MRRAAWAELAAPEDGRTPESWATRPQDAPGASSDQEKLP